MSRRGKLEITKDILELCRTPVKKTTIVYRCNLNFKIVKKYLKCCFHNGWLVEEKIEKRSLYTTTELGKDFINKFNQFVYTIQF